MYPPMGHRSLEHHYTRSVSHIEECTYTHGRCAVRVHTGRSTPPVDMPVDLVKLIWADQLVDLPPQYWHLVVKNGNFTFLLLEFILADKLADLPLIEHRCLEHHYTKSMSHIEECTYTHGRCNPLWGIDLWNTTRPDQCHI